MKKTLIGRFMIITLVALGLTAGVLGCSSSAEYPTKAIDLVCTSSPGGGVDVAARICAKYLSSELGVPVNVVNKPGGNHIPGVLSVLNAKADGYTLMVDSANNGSLQAISKDVPYQLEDRTCVARMMNSVTVFFVNGKSPWNSLDDVIAAAKEDPASFSWSRLGGNTTTDFAMLQFFNAAGIDISKTKRIPFEGVGPAVTGVAGNNVQFGAGGASAVFALHKSGDIKVLAVTGDQRLASLEDVPTTAEIGLPTVDLGWWIGISGPKDLPKDVVDVLAAAAKKAVENPEVIKQLEAIGAYPAYLDPTQLQDYEVKEAAMFQELAEKVGELN